MFDVVLVLNANASLFEDLLNLFNQLLRELGLFILLLKFILGLGEDFLVGSGLEGQSAVVGRHQDVVFDPAFNASLADVESVVGVVIQVHFFVLFLHSREVALKPLLAELHLI